MHAYLRFTGSKNLVNLLVSFQRSSQYYKHLLLMMCKLKSYPKFLLFVLKRRTFLYLKSDSHLSKKLVLFAFNVSPLKMMKNASS